VRVVSLRVPAILVFATACLSQPPPPAADGGGGGDGGMPPPASWSSVAAGTIHTCGIRADKTLWCWGRNDSGQLGSGDVEQDVPEQVGSATWSAVAAGGIDTCAIDSFDGLWCWGDNTAGQLGTGASSQTPVVAPTPVGSDAWSAIAVGGSHTCGLHTDGSLWCWGIDANGELGINSFAEMAVPTEVGPGSNYGSDIPTSWSAVAIAEAFSCAIATDASLWCWGGSLSDGNGQAFAFPVLVGSAGDRWKQIAAGGTTACGLHTDGSLACWGGNGSGQVGNDSTAPASTPVTVGAGPIASATWTAVAVGLAHSCAIQTTGALYCWGNNVDGQLGSATSEAYTTLPVPITSPSVSWQTLALGDAHTCAIDTDHHMWCVGQNGGQLGTLIGGSRTTPELIGSAMAVAVGADLSGNTGGTACAIETNGALACWGNNANGAVGDGTTSNRDMPTPIAAGDRWLSVAVSDHVCATDVGSSLYCWGNNDNGAIGNDSDVDQVTPLALDIGASHSVAVGRHTCILDNGGGAYCWGFNRTGQTGVSGGSNVATPQPVSAPWSTIAAGDVHTCGINELGSALCWGDDSYGELGSGSGEVGAGAANPTPELVAGLPAGPYDQLALGGGYTCIGSASAGSNFWCFGDNTNGQIGNQNAGSTVTTPFWLPGNWLQLSAGEAHTCGVAADHTLSCWGDNAYGQLGLGTFAEFHEPHAVGSDTDWQTVAAGQHDTCALKTTGALYCWGRNLEGELGDGTAWQSTFALVY
jgi:alpha-tubulin suppressor-like RCC1 family protein